MSTEVNPQTELLRSTSPTFWVPFSVGLEHFQAILIIPKDTWVLSWSVHFCDGFIVRVRIVYPPIMHCNALGVVSSIQEWSCNFGIDVVLSNLGWNRRELQWTLISILPLNTAIIVCEEGHVIKFCFKPWETWPHHFFLMAEWGGLIVGGSCANNLNSLV